MEFKNTTGEGLVHEKLVAEARPAIKPKKLPKRECADCAIAVDVEGVRVDCCKKVRAVHYDYAPNLLVETFSQDKSWAKIRNQTLRAGMRVHV